MNSNTIYGYPQSHFQYPPYGHQFVSNGSTMQIDPAGMYPVQMHPNLSFVHPSWTNMYPGMPHPQQFYQTVPPQMVQTMPPNTNGAPQVIQGVLTTPKAMSPTAQLAPELFPITAQVVQQPVVKTSPPTTSVVSSSPPAFQQDPLPSADHLFQTSTGKQPSTLKPQSSRKQPSTDKKPSPRPLNAGKAGGSSLTTNASPPNPNIPGLHPTQVALNPDRRRVQTIPAILPAGPDLVTPASLSQALREQKGQRTPIGEGPLLCQVCAMRFHNQIFFLAHQRMHMYQPEPEIQCQTCRKTFAEKSSLKRHMRIHSGIKPYRCSRCPMEFAERSDRKKHERRHTGVKPYKCDVCGATFVTSYSLTEHRRTHTGEKPHTCDRCQKNFRQRSNLRRHAAKCVGTGVNVDEGTAAAGTATAGGPSCHVKDEHGQTNSKPSKESKTNCEPPPKRRKTDETASKPNVCDSCPQAFSRKASLVTHRKKSHGILVGSIPPPPPPGCPPPESGQHSAVALLSTNENPLSTPPPPSP
eukprot:950824_1